MDPKDPKTNLWDVNISSLKFSLNSIIDGYYKYRVSIDGFASIIETRVESGQWRCQNEYKDDGL